MDFPHSYIPKFCFLRLDGEVEPMKVKPLTLMQQLLWGGSPLGRRSPVLGAPECILLVH